MRQFYLIQPSSTVDIGYHLLLGDCRVQKCFLFQATMGNEQNANVYSGTGIPGPPNYQPQAYPQVYPQVQPQVYPHVNPQVHPHVHPQIHVMQPTAGPLPMGEVYVMPQLGSDPQQLKCPTCRSMITTRVEYESYLTTHLIAGGLCLVGCFFLFCWFCAPCPYCKFLFLSFYSIGFGVAKNVFLGMSSCKKANHSCPKCNAFIGSNKS